MADKVDIQIDQKQLSAIIKSLDPAIVRKETGDLMKDIGHHGRGAARQAISGGTEQAKISILFDAKPLEAKVYSVMPQARALSIEEGRKPGEDAPFLQIARWVTGRRHMTARRVSELSAAERSQIETVRTNIQARGTKGKKFIEAARSAIARDLTGMLDLMAKKIESRFGKK